jgi:membrane-associated protease RseP (regulator of RpoE activity)
MTLFLEILITNVILLAGLITVHELGHWTLGRLAGIPAGQMRIRLLTFPQQVVLRDGGKWVSVSEYDRYFGILRNLVPSRSGQFAYVIGGFLFETFAIALIWWAFLFRGMWIMGLVAPGLSLSMYLVYLFAMDLPQARKLGKPWGDTTILNALAPGSGVVVAGAMIIVRLLMIIGAAVTLP